MKKIKIALLGFGTVGRATYELLQMNTAEIAEKTGLELVLTKVLVRDLSKSYPVSKRLLTTDFNDILNDPQIELVIELIGGIEPASSYILAALRAKKHVVTANKAAVAANYASFIETSRQNRVMLRFEASVAGGIPVLDALQAPLNSNQIEEVSGIVNGTTNYILTQMVEQQQSYQAALARAQEKGFAETDPTADVEGIDSANKLAILMALAFSELVSVDAIPTTGISNLSSLDMIQAEKLGYKIKLLATTKKVGQQLQASVQPTLVASWHMLAAVANEFNAIHIRGNAVGDLLFYGKGAGGLPTASAVMGDMIEIANAIEKNAAFDSYINKVSATQLTFIGEGFNRYYLRLTGLNKAGTLGKITTIFGQFGISIESISQESEEKQASMIFIINEINRTQLDDALDALLLLAEVTSIDSVLRVLD